MAAYTKQSTATSVAARFSDFSKDAIQQWENAHRNRDNAQIAKAAQRLEAEANSQ